MLSAIAYDVQFFTSQTKQYKEMPPLIYHWLCMMWCQVFTISGVIFLEERTRNSIPICFGPGIKELTKKGVNP